MDDNVKTFHAIDETGFPLTPELSDSLYDKFLNTSAKVQSIHEAILVKQVCTAEKESQKLLSKLYAYRAPIGKITSGIAWLEACLYNVFLQQLYLP